MEERLEQLKQQQATLRLQLDEVSVLVTAYTNAIAQKEEAEKAEEEEVKEEDKYWQNEDYTQIFMLNENALSLVVEKK